jgi:DNA polymerase-1
MLRVHRELRAQGLQTRMLLQIHDELVFEVPLAELETVSGLVRTHMEAAMALRVPLVANLQHGQSLDKE